MKSFPVNGCAWSIKPAYYPNSSFHKPFDSTIKTNITKKIKSPARGHICKELISGHIDQSGPRQPKDLECRLREKVMIDKSSDSFSRNAAESLTVDVVLSLTGQATTNPRPKILVFTYQRRYTLSDHASFNARKTDFLLIFILNNICNFYLSTTILLN